MLRFTSLASGSGGNATLIEARDGERTSRLLVDCGLTLRALTQALARRGCTPADLDAVFVTHEHSDHVAGVLRLQRRFGTAVWTSAGTARWMLKRAAGAAPELLIARDGEPIAIGALTLHPFAVPHDAAEPLQLVCRAGEARLGVLTDLGEPTPAVLLALQGCDALLLECNHDRAMLADGPYPAWLKRRVGGSRGHLANEQSAEVLAACRHDALRHVVAAHLSLHNNEPGRVLAALRSALVHGRSRQPQLHVADATTGCGWLDVSST